MKLVIFGLTISSSWGNGHATIWRGLCHSLVRRGHEVVFFERDVSYYARHRDYHEIPGGTLHLYPEWEDALPLARAHLADADVGVVTSYCVDALPAARMILDSAAVSVFYDLDTGPTLDALRRGEEVPYIPPGGLGDFDLVLSWTGGEALGELRERLGARRVLPLYGSVDPEVHRGAETVEHYRADLSYLGTYAEDRQAVVEKLFLEPARRLPEQRFLIGGSMYPYEFPWGPNIYYVRHVPPGDHPAFYSSSRMTLNVTRGAMAKLGYCPSGRLFEAAACGTPILSDWFEGLDTFFTPGEELLVARDAEDTVRALEMPREELERIARRARERVLEEHTAERRVMELEAAIEEASGATVEGGAPAEWRAGRHSKVEV